MKHQDLLDRMTLGQKCSLLSGRDMWSARPLDDVGVPSITLSDGPSGVRRQLGAGDQLGLHESEKATCFPSASTIANSWDTDLAETIGEALGREASRHGVDVLLGPGLNIKRSPLCGRNFEYFSEDPYLSGKMAAGYIRGIQSQSVAACPKHFAVNSQELHRMASDSRLDERTLREIYLTNFEIAVKEGKPKTIMSAYNAVNGEYANENAHLLKEILRGEWGFDGVVVTDWGGGNDVVQGVRNGSNLEMPSTKGDSPWQLYRAVESGSLSEADLDARVDELLDVIMWVSQRRMRTTDIDAQDGVAQLAAERSIVLLKNEDNILPLSKEANVVIIGDFAKAPRYQGAGSSMVNPSRLTNALDCAGAFFANGAAFARGFTRADAWDEALAAEAVSLAKYADAVLLYLGLPEVFEAEGLDRAHMRIPNNQVRLLEAVAKANPNVVVVFSGGCAVEMPWLDQCKALVWAGLGGQAGARATLKVLTGEVNPGGKLSETFPARYEDLPVSRLFPSQRRECEYREGLFVGYRFTETMGAETLFPFGYGLSYTSFAYGGIEAATDHVSFDLTNTGSVAGDEIAQAYVGIANGLVLRPAKELKGFARVHLEPGETRRVTIPLDDKAFRYFNPLTNRFEVEGGEWSVMVGANIRDIWLSAVVSVEGSGAKVPDSNLQSSAPADLMNVSDKEFETMLGEPIGGGALEQPLRLNDPIDALVRAKNPLTRFVIRRMLQRRERSIAMGKPDLNILFMTNMPFRSIAKMMNGMVSMRMAEGLVDFANGHWLRGLGQVICGFVTRPSLRKLLSVKGERRCASASSVENI